MSKEKQNSENPKFFKRKDTLNQPSIKINHNNGLQSQLNMTNFNNFKNNKGILMKNNQFNQINLPFGKIENPNNLTKNLWTRDINNFASPTKLNNLGSASKIKNLSNANSNKYVSKLK